MNKIDLAVALMERHEMTRKDAIALIDGVFEDIQDAVVASDTVKIPGFGQFKVRDRAARIGRNPATGEKVKIPAKRVFKFLPAKALKDAVMSKRGGGAARKKTAAASRKKAAPAARKKAAPARKAPARKSAAKKGARKR